MITAVCLPELKPPLAAAGLAAIKALGIAQIRYGINDDEWNPQERGYATQGQIANDIDVLYSSGLRIHANMSWCAPWKAGGSIAWRPYVLGCSRWVDKHDPVDPAKYGGGWEFADDREYCRNVAHIDPKWMRRDGEQFISHFNSDVKVIHAVSCGNEPDGDAYNPVLHFGTQDEAFDRYANEYSFPFLRGAVAAVTTWSPLIVGPEAAGSDGLRRMLEWARWALKTGPQFDAVSMHGYANDDYPGFPGGALRRWREDFMPQIEAHRKLVSKPFEVWNTECGGDRGAPFNGEDVMNYLEGMEQMGVAVVTHNAVTDLFRDWTGKVDEEGNRIYDYTPTEIGLAYKAFNERTTELARRRAANHE